MKTAISIPDPLFQEADELAGRLGLSRSELFARAVERYVRRHRHDKVTDALNRVYGRQSSQLDGVLERLQTASLPHDEW